MQNEQRSSHPFITVTYAVGPPADARHRGQEARAPEVEHGAHGRRAAEHRVLEQARELDDVVGTDDEIDAVELTEQRLALLLRDAPGDDQHLRRAVALPLGDPADLAPELLLGLLAHAARVQHEHVGVEAAGGLALFQPAPSSTSRIRAESCTFIWQPNVWMKKRHDSGSRVSDASRLTGYGVRS